MISKPPAHHASIVRSLLTALLALSAAGMIVIAAAPSTAHGQPSPDEAAGSAAGDSTGSTGSVDSGDSGEKNNEPPAHAITVATDAEKAIYEAVKRTAANYNPQDVARDARQTGFCDRVGTHYAMYLETCVWGWRFSGDEAWLDRFVSMMKALEAALTEDPDGRKGWYSEPDVRRWGVPWPTGWQAGLFTASQPAEARVGAAVAEFAITADKGSPDFRLKYSIPAMHWVKLFTEELMPKWDQLGCLEELSEGRAAYRYPDQAFGPVSRKWSPYPERPGNRSITLPHPYQSEIIRQYLKFWQATGKQDYRDRAAALLKWQKSCLRPGKRLSYWWHFFDPASDHDFRPEGGLAFGMYMHPDPVFAARDVEAFVEAYHCGVVIDRGDIQRLVNTQTQIMMAVGDDERVSQWRYSNGQDGRGMVWPALAEFNDHIESLAWAGMDGRNLQFGSPLRLLQEKPRWGGWAQRKLGEAEVIEWKKNYNDFKQEAEALLKAHPAPDPLKDVKR